MPDIPILGQTPAKTEAEKAIEDAKAAYDALSDEEKARLADLADREEGEAVATAFLVVLHHDGSIDVQGDLATKYVLARTATVDDIVAGASVAISDINSGKTAQQTAMQMMQMTQMAQRQMAQQQQAAQIQAQIAREGALTKKR